MKRSVSIRRSMLINLVLVIVLLSGSILLITVIGAQGAVRELSSVVLTEMLDHTESRLREFFDPMKNELKLAWTWGKAGVFDLDEPEQLNRHLIPLMMQHRQIGSLVVADEYGREHMILRQDEQWSNRQTRPTGDGTESWTESLFWDWQDIREQPTQRDWKNIGYDPRQRPWYKGAIRRYEPSGAGLEALLDKVSIFWTRPYDFFATGEPGITASMSFTSQDGVKHVIGFDVLLDDISEFTTNLQVMERGVVVVLDVDHDGLVIGLPHHERFMSKQGREAALSPLRRSEDLGLQLSVDASAAFADEPEENVINGNFPPRQFTSGGELWWGAGREYRLSPDRTLLIGVIVPHADLLGNLPAQRLWIVVTTAVVLLGALWRAVTLAKTYAEPVERLAMQSDLISQGKLNHRLEIESPIKEMRRLTEAQEHMRISLQNLLKLESDLQLARKIQQSTFPSRLPAIDGFEVDVWSEPADETGGDTYDVIGFDVPSNGGPVMLSEEKADHAVMLLADATGHGIGPALSVTQVRAMLRMAVRMKGDLQSIAGNLNEQLCADLPAGRFITAWLGEIDTKNKSLRSFSAGQGPILRYIASSREVKVDHADEPPFGIMGDLNLTIGQPVVLEKGDILAVISDGVYEAVNRADQQFGTDRVVQVLKENSRQSAGDILSALREALEAFTDGVPANDDRTAVIVKRV